MISSLGLVGVGLIGGSLALSLKKKYPFLHITGWDIDRDHLVKAKEIGIIDKIATIEEISGCDCCLVATPVSVIADYVIELCRLNEKAVVFDVGSVKKPVVDRVLQAGFSARYVPFHPIAGTENFGPEAAFDGLFEGAYGIITPYEGIDQNAVKLVENLMLKLGMEIKFMSPQRHDTVFGYVSHLPHVVAYALTNLISEKPEDFRFAGGGFRDYTRVAASSEEMWTDIFLLNRDNVVEAIEEYIGQINRIKELIKAGDAKALKKLLKQARLFKRSLDG